MTHRTIDETGRDVLPERRLQWRRLEHTDVLRATDEMLVRSEWVTLPDELVGYTARCGDFRRPVWDGKE